MRFLDYPGRGRPTLLSTALQELAVLTLAAIESVNVDRWALSVAQRPYPSSLGTLRQSAYETEVVGRVHNLGQRLWERRGEVAVWERPFHSGDRGRPPAVDVALFEEDLSDPLKSTETRLEFGEVDNSTLTSKLKKDAQKLESLCASKHPGYPVIANYILLWRISGVKMTKELRLQHREAFTKAAREAAKTLQTTSTITLLAVAGGDLFAPGAGNKQHHWGEVALFQVIVPQGTTPSNGR